MFTPSRYQQRIVLIAQYNFRFVAVGLLVLLSLTSIARAGEVSDVLDMDRYRGQVVLVDFWASWCVPCRRSFPWMDAMQKKYRDLGLVIVAVNEDDAWSDAEAFLAEYPADINIVRDAGGKLAQEHDLQAMPSSFLYDRDGRLVHRQYGFKSRDVEVYEQAFLELLDAPHSVETDGDERNQS